MPMYDVVKNILFYALLGTLIHSAGCIINDMLDRDFDRKVERLKGRPIASGAVTVTEASVLWCLNTSPIVFSFTLGVVGLPACGGTYPLMKRWIYWPSLFLGFATSWAVPFTWVATTGQFDWSMTRTPQSLPAGNWICLYDTIYACQDNKDDEKAVVKSMAVHLGEGIRPTLSLFDATFFA
ncbi:hypothetical protein DFH29DRAFT_1037269 [Suillus ampliporus]|nr:hypothetical protein DFH29DRAFT_1037269 [Suillus ampliporus]